jgi:hypothetical protein
MRRLWICALLPLGASAACDCPVGVPVCNAVAYSNMVFIGTVESISPMFLSDYNVSRRPELDALYQANEKYLAAPSAQNLAAMKDVFRKAFPDLQNDQRDRLDKANSQKALVDLFYSVLGREKRVRFHVATLYRNAGDDDDEPKPAAKTQAAGKKGTPAASKAKPAPTPAKDDDDDAKIQELDIYTPFGDCGYDFQIGETYLVYAYSDEDTNVVETDRCSRTSRLTDAGPDLAYLYFYKEHKEAAGRVEGFATFDPLWAATPHGPDAIDLPDPGLTVELKSAAGARYTLSDSAGKFLFDGLAPGGYELSGYAPGFPDVLKALSGPKRFQIDARGCANQVLLVPKTP